MERRVLGILGGMGPLASAEFLRTIYKLNPVDVEQESPVCFLHSDPTFPDRTEAILKGAEDSLVKPLGKALEKLYGLGSHKVVIACVTMHHLLPRVPLELRRGIISLVELTVEEALKSGKRHLLLCTDGTRKSGVFQSHERWRLAQARVALPDDGDQRDIHALIYRIKKNGRTPAAIRQVRDLLRKYRVDSYISGCTELHLLSEDFAGSVRGGVADRNVIDPLWIIAKEYKKLLAT
jgi:aspartate racemase